ncbi:FG-GAP-like repeat-containing protein [Seonamhaeicola maritimus]|nr:FG-GAP-like repeat-containing protein [Seonamhaeicola maritimus]
MKTLPYLLCTFFLMLSLSIYSQTFQRFEHIANLDGLHENNGVAVADYDGDYDLDLFVVAKAQDINGNPISQSKLFRNNNDGTFTDITIASGLANLFPASEPSKDIGYQDGFKYGAHWGDYDNDGYPDIFFTHAYKVQLFRNNGDGTFTETTNQAGIERTNNCNNAGATWFDFNNDSYIDLYISVWGGCNGNIFYVNNGDGTFEERSEFYGINSPEQSYMSIPYDFNEDGWMDLFVSNDFYVPNNLYINNFGSIFEDQAANYGIDQLANFMGLSISDYNNDGNFDIYVTDINMNLLFTNNGDNSFTEQAEEKGILRTGWSWDCPFADFDLDGDEDLFVVNGFKQSFPEGEANVYFENNGPNDYTFTEKTGNVGLGAITMSVGATPFDYDNDGDLDLFVSNSDQESFFYQNTTITTTSTQNPRWFKVMLEGTTSNRNAIGASVSITTNEGSLHRYASGVGFLSQSIQPLHFGLSDATSISEIEIKWPSGLIETYNDLPLDNIILAREGNGYEIIDTSQAVKVKGCTDPNSCNFNPEAVEDDGSCSYLDGSQISGPTSTGYFNEEIYTYNKTTNSTLSWEVIGGEIITGQNTETIKVLWHLEDEGEVSVIETSTNCATEKIILPVDLTISKITANRSIARIWNEALLHAIRNDYARPTVHARNLFHTSVALYDAWAIFDENARTYLLGNEVHGIVIPFYGFETEEPIEEARKKAMSYAAYRLLSHRFKNSPNLAETQHTFDLLMTDLGYNINFTDTDHTNGNPAALGNYIAQAIIDYGFKDGANEAGAYENKFYEPVNTPLTPQLQGNVTLTDPNRWQQLSLYQFIDQSGNLIAGNTPDFLGPEWGQVLPFSLKEDNKSTFTRDGYNYQVYHDPSPPPYLNLNSEDTDSQSYKWGFSLVSVWGSHLDPADGVIWDISPKSIGNFDINNIPQSFEDFPDFYNEFEGGDPSQGHSINPHTNAPYPEQLVPRGDYARVLAEFWADGPDSETPPGHWFTLLNYVSDHPALQKKLNGTGETMSPLEWDVKAYFLMGGTMHDAAVSAWGVKGWYDYIRPISAIRYMAELGQSSDNMLSNYHVGGIPLKPGYVEIVETGDPLAGTMNEHVGKIKLYTWRGHDFIGNPSTDMAGVGWILADNWWPYQRPSFVTPPFAGYVSGHSTYSRAAAELMTLITGDAFFPGGVGEFIAKKDEFLVFEEGPSVDVKLQWATYRDASDQCSLSRIWGGIHPPADDIPGRLIGEKIGKEAYSFGVEYFTGKEETNTPSAYSYKVYPNPLNDEFKVFITNTTLTDEFQLADLKGSVIATLSKQHNEETGVTEIHLPYSLASGVYVLTINNESKLIVKP